MIDLNDKLEIDTLQLYFGEPFIIHDDIFNDIQILQPTIGDIIKEGEKKSILLLISLLLILHLIEFNYGI